MISPIFQEYADLMRTIKNLEQQRQELMVKVLDEIDDLGQKEVKTKIGTFISRGRKTYSYSMNISKMQAEILKAKHEEEKNGTALLEKHISYVQFIPIK